MSAADNRVSQIIVWGDSMTQVWPQYLQALLDVPVIYKGAGGTNVQYAEKGLNDWLAATPANIVATTGHICWCGHTNYNSTNVNNGTGPETIMPTLLRMAGSLDSFGPGLFRPIGLTNGPADPKGSDGYKTIVEDGIPGTDPASRTALNERMADAFRASYAEVRGYLVTDGLRMAGMTATPTDTENIKNDIPPRSVRTDGGNPAHLNDAGKYVTAQRLAQLLRDGGWAAPATDDADGDLVSNAGDNCPTVVNPSQVDGDLDGRGDDCNAPVTVTVSKALMEESYGAATFTIELSSPVAVDVKVSYATGDGVTTNPRATANEDYVPATGTFTFVAGDTREYLRPVVLDDTAGEGDEEFTLRLSVPPRSPAAPPAVATVGSALGTATIGNDVGDVAIAGDVTPPTVISQKPAAGATAVPVASNVLVSFSEPMAGVNSNTFTLTDPAGSVVPAAPVKYDAVNRSTTINPTTNLLPDTRYTAKLYGGPSLIRDASGNPLATTTWTFLTGPAPKVKATTPVNNATAVSRTANLTVTFTEKVADVSTTTLTLKNATTNAIFTATVTLSTSSTVKYTVNPTGTLSPNTRYTITVTGGPSAIKDTAGNPLISYTSSFTTGA